MPAAALRTATGITWTQHAQSRTQCHGSSPEHAGPLGGHAHDVVAAAAGAMARPGAEDAGPAAAAPVCGGYLAVGRGVAAADAQREGLIRQRVDFMNGLMGRGGGNAHGERARKAARQEFKCMRRRSCCSIKSFTYMACGDGYGAKACSHRRTHAHKHTHIHTHAHMHTPAGTRRASDWSPLV